MADFDYKCPIPNYRYDMADQRSSNIGFFLYLRRQWSFRQRIQGVFPGVFGRETDAVKMCQHMRCEGRLHSVLPLSPALMVTRMHLWSGCCSGLRSSSLLQVL